MKKIYRFGIGLYGAVAMLTATSASAHAYLEASNPAAGATVKSPRQITLHMSEKLLPQFSGFALYAGKTPVPVNVKIADGQMVGTLVTTLRSGTYQIRWHAVTADTHRMENSFTFTVK